MPEQPSDRKPSMIQEEGTVKGDVSLSYTKTGKAVAHLTVEQTKGTSVIRWKLTAWAELADHIADSLQDGDPVVFAGMHQADRAFESKSGGGIARHDVTAKWVGVDLRRTEVDIKPIAHPGLETMVEGMGL